MTAHNTPADKAEVLDRFGFEILSGMRGLTTTQRIEYSKEIYGMEILPDHMPYVPDVKNLEPYVGLTRDYKCAHCSREVTGMVVARNIETYVTWIVCPSCSRGSVLNGTMLSPSPLLGADVQGLPEEVGKAYLEARKSFSSASFTACELVCRKILMNVAVDKGAPTNRQFKEYVDYMNNSGYIPVTMKPAVERIKDNGNEATHEIRQPDQQRANATLQFTTLLLKNVYETEELLNEGSSANS